MMTTETRAAIKPYSMAVAPSSSFQNLRNAMPSKIAERWGVVIYDRLARVNSMHETSAYVSAECAILHRGVGIVLVVVKNVA